MSHIVQIKTQVREPAAIHAACRRLGLTEPVYGEAELYSGSKTGWQVQLLNWKYPIVCDVSEGHIDYDNFDGRWGQQEQLDKFLQMYAVERAKLEARKQGHTVTEQSLSDGSIKLTVNAEGGAF